jgi:hypothetical protein
MCIKATLTFLNENFGINKVDEELERKEEIIAFLQLNYIHTINMFSEDL